MKAAAARKKAKDFMMVVGSWLERVAKRLEMVRKWLESGLKVAECCMSFGVKRSMNVE